jgi:sulfatase-like protein
MAPDGAAAAEPSPTKAKAAAPPVTSPARFPVRELARNFVHLAAVAAFAFAEPLLRLLGDNPAFFAAHNSTRWQIIGFAVGLVVIPPLIALAVQAVGGLILPALRWPLHLVGMAFFAAVFALQGVRHSSMAPFLVFLIAGLIGVAIAAFYATEHWARSVIGVLGIAPIAFLVLFIFFSPTHKITLAGASGALDVEGGKSPPIIFIQFDEFPAYTVMNGQERIDAKRFPNFARLAAAGTWYRNATTAHENTVFSVPSILDGRWPDPHGEPILADHKNNLFTLLGKRYNVDAYESVANLCPPGLCASQGDKGAYHDFRVMLSDANVVFQHQVAPEKLQHTIPSIDDRWAHFRQSDAKANVKKGASAVLSTLRSGTRAAVFTKQVKRMNPGARPLLSYMHILMPHEPRQYLPDGREYQAGGDNETALDGFQSFHNGFLTEQSLQRDELQTQYTDRLIGEMIDHLQRVGLWKKAMVVVLSDHGESFIKARPGQKIKPSYPGNISWRRAVTQENIGQIANIPMFIKYPGQTKGKTDDRWVKSIDVLPTVAAALKIKLPFKVDGRALQDPAYRGRSPVRVETTLGKYVAAPPARVAALRAQAIRYRDGLFGSGAEGPGYWGIGPDPELHGKPVRALNVQPAGPLRASIIQPRGFGFADVELGSGNSPSQIFGRLRGGDPGGHPIAVAVNGRIAGTGVTFSPLGTTKTSFSVFVPDTSFRDGANQVAVYEIESPTTLRLLGRTGGE